MMVQDVTVQYISVFIQKTFIYFRSAPGHVDSADATDNGALVAVGGSRSQVLWLRKSFMPIKTHRGMHGLAKGFYPFYFCYCCLDLFSCLYPLTVQACCPGHTPQLSGLSELVVAPRYEFAHGAMGRWIDSSWWTH